MMSDNCNQHYLGFMAHQLLAPSMQKQHLLLENSMVHGDTTLLLPTVQTLDQSKM